MLPNLGGLALHRPDATGGFYEVPPEEQARVNTDPITLEKPLHTMSFRVRLAENDSNGRPQYKYFSPFALWEWVKEHNTLPSREGPIWYEDWWALCNTYNPDHHNIPAWAYHLKHRSQYLAERAREAARLAQEAARARARPRAALCPHWAAAAAGGAVDSTPALPAPRARLPGPRERFLS